MSGVAIVRAARRRLGALSLALVGGLVPAPADAQELGTDPTDVKVHAFVSQGVIKTTKNNYLAHSDREVFSRTVLRRSTAAVRSYWMQRIFSGREVPPPELDGDGAVVNYVASHVGAVGYVSTSANVSTVKPLVVH